MKSPPWKQMNLSPEKGILRGEGFDGIHGDRHLAGLFSRRYGLSRKPLQQPRAVLLLRSAASQTRNCDSLQLEGGGTLKGTSQERNNSGVKSRTSPEPPHYLYPQGICPKEPEVQPQSLQCKSHLPQRQTQKTRNSRRKINEQAPIM